MATRSSWLQAKAQLTTEKELYIGCFRDAQKNYGVALLNHNYKKIWSSLLLHRGHGIIFHPQQKHIISFPRRPGYEIVIHNPFTQQKTLIVQSLPGQHFYGHGVLSPDNQYLLATVNDYQHKKGLISVFDTHKNYELVNQLNTHGIGPHDILFDSQNHIFVANGGLFTKPSEGRKVLNLESMQSSIAQLDWPSGKCLKQYISPFKKLSLRHMTINSGNIVAFAGQYQGSLDDEVPLVGFIQEGMMKWLPMPDFSGHLFQQYIGSISYDISGQTLAATSPRGNQFILWADIEHTPSIETSHIIDVCGLCPTVENHTFLATNGLGQCWEIASQQEPLMKTIYPGLSWDNHLTKI